MNPMSPLPTDRAPSLADADDAADLRLRQALRHAPLAVDAGRVDALQSRILAQWQAAHGTAAAASRQGRSLAMLGTPRRRWLLGSGMALGGVALVLGLWVQRPDPVLEELMQPDVLSQMAVGEM